MLATVGSKRCIELKKSPTCFENKLQGLRFNRRWTVMFSKNILVEESLLLHRLVLQPFLGASASLAPPLYSSGASPDPSSKAELSEHFWF